MADDLEQSQPFNLTWLKDDISIRKDNHLAPLFEMFDDIERAKKQASAKAIVRQESRYRQQMGATRVFQAIALQQLPSMDSALPQNQ